MEELAQQALQAPDPAARIAALKALSQRTGEEDKIRPTVNAALQDQDLGVRTAALDLAARGAPVSEEAIGRIALSDADPGLRLIALDDLADRSDAGYRYRVPEAGDTGSGSESGIEVHGD
ncbi:MAG: HEAT repeat domain-containing protein [Chromatiales bacterium]|nr:HEAT repeat domain-containing protein [Chromatiales bacterium]